MGRADGGERQGGIRRGFDSGYQMPTIKTAHGMRNKVYTRTARKGLFQKLVHLLCTFFNRAGPWKWCQPCFSLPQEKAYPLTPTTTTLTPILSLKTSRTLAQ